MSKSKMKFRSPDAIKRREKRKQEYRLAHRITLDFSDYDPIRNDKTYTVASEQIIRDQLKAVFEGGEPAHALNHEYGEVLNHFGP